MNRARLRRLALPAGVLGLVLAIACGADEPAARRKGQLREGVIANVGEVGIALATVERIAAAQSLDGEAALRRALTDARLALAARDGVSSATRAAIERAALGRALLEGIEADARAAGPPSDAELEELSRLRWIELDRPAAVRVTHAVALRKKPGDAKLARNVAEQLLRAVAGISDPKAFMAAARAVPGNGIEVRAERLPYIAADGRGFAFQPAPESAGTFDERFAIAANALRRAGEQSGVVESDFGFHVILLEERLPERRVPLSERRAVLRPEILSRRAEHARGELVSRLRAASAVEIQRDFAALTGKLTR